MHLIFHLGTVLIFENVQNSGERLQKTIDCASKIISIVSPQHNLVFQSKRIWPCEK